MKKTLLISYTPRNESNTAKLVQTFIEVGKGKTNIDLLDLVDTPAPILLRDDINAMLKRNFMGLALTEGEKQSLGQADQLTEQLQQADRIVLAFPMYNFCVPAAVKAWFDLVMQKDRTFKVKDDGSYEGLCQGKKALILMTTGGDYSQEPAKSMNFAVPLANTCLGFMGIEPHNICAFGLNRYMDKADEIIADTQQEISTFLSGSDFI